MATLFSDAFSDSTGLVPYRSNGALVKVATFSFITPPVSTSVTTASRINLFILPYNSRILYGFIDVVTNCGAILCNLVAIDGPAHTVLWSGGSIVLVAPNQYRVDRASRGMLYTSPPDVSAGLRTNAGVRIALAPVISGNTIPNGQVRGYFLYV